MKKTKILELTALSAICAIMLSSCSKTVIESETPNASFGGNSSINIVTRSGDEGAVISYPVNAYLFDSDDNCIATETLTEGTGFSFDELKAGTYHVYVVAGADDTRYLLPTQETATATFAITLQENKVHEDLMTANNTITLGQNETNQTNLALQRAVCMLKTIEVKQVPTDVDAVSISFAPLREAVQLNGTATGEEGTFSHALTEQSDGTTWKNVTSQYMLPSVGNPTITIRMTKGQTTRSYTYTCNEAFAANYKINIDATFTGATFNLTGTITGATWAGERTITFEFDETSSTGSGNEEPGNNDPGNNNNDALDGPAPTVGSNYNGTYVLRAVDNGDNTTTVTLMSAGERTGLEFTNTNQTSIKTAVDAALEELEVEGIDGWRLPTIEELSYLSNNDYYLTVKTNLTTIGFTTLTVGNTSCYYFGIDNEDNIVNYKLDSGNTSLPDNKTHLRAFTTLTFNNQ